MSQKGYLKQQTHDVSVRDHLIANVSIGREEQIKSSGFGRVEELSPGTLGRDGGC
jgi:hypothetical protein